MRFRFGMVGGVIENAYRMSKEDKYFEQAVSIEETIELITAKLGEKLSIAPSDIFIVMSEPPLENWGMGGYQKE